jgi:hypothetical protein
MPANFSVQFIVNEKTQTRVLKLTDTSTGFTLAKGNFSVTFPDGSTRIKTDFLSPDISAPAGFVNIPAVLDTENNVLTGTYKIDFVALDASSTSYSSTITFDFNWVKPKNGITNQSDVLIPEVKFSDSNSYSPIGSFTGTLSRTLSASFPSTSEASGGSVSSVSSNIIDVVSSGKYYDGTYNPSCDVSVNYIFSGDARVTISYIELFTKTYLIKRCPTQLELVIKINNYRALIDAYKDKNDTQFNILSEQYDLVIALYTHIITRYETSTQDGSEPILRELLSILEPYATSYTPQLTRMLPFQIASTGTDSFTISDGTNTDTVPLGSTLLLSSGNPALTIGVFDNMITYTPVFGTTTNTFVQGNDSRMHNPVTIGTANGLSLSSQALSLAAATVSTPGAMSASDKAKLDGIATGANVGTVTSVGLSAPTAFTVTNSPVTGSGTIVLSANGSPSQYITGAGALSTFLTDVRAGISLTTTGTSGSATYNSSTGVLNIPQYQGGVTSFNTRTGAVTLTSSDVTTALTYTPQEPITLTTTGTSGAATFVGNTLNIPQYQGGVTSFNTRTGAITLTSSDVTTALTYTPQAQLTLTTTGTSGTATLIGNTLNIPQYSGGSGSGTLRSVQNFTATAGQTTFTISGGYTAGQLDVFLNGVRLTGADYTASNGTTVVLTTGALVNDIIDVLSYQGLSGYVSAAAKQDALSGTGFVKISGTTISYDNSAYLTSYTETDPVFLASAAYGITSTNISNWNSAYVWGNHASAGYLTSFTETDPVFVASAAYGITSTNITNWNIAYTNRITSLTTTGTSGAATLIGNTLNIPNYTVLSIGGANTQIQFNNSGALGGSASLTWDGTSITATNQISTGGTAAYGAFTPTFADGIVVDYVSGWGRISVAGGDGIQFFNGGVGASLLGSVTSGGDWDFNGNLIIGTGTVITGAANAILQMAATSTGYVQAYIHNDNAGASSSSDIACYPDNGVDTSGWIDMGITSSVYSDASYTTTGANEGYIFMSAPSGASKTGNLVFATDSTGTQNYFQWYVGGFGQAKSAFKMQLKSTALDLSIPLNSTVATGTAPFTVASTTQVANLFATKAATVSDGSIGISSLSATGTASSTTYLRGDNTWATITASGGTVTSVAALTLGTTGTDLSSSVATGTTTPVITLNVPTASASNRGALSSTDWSTFNGKQNAITLTTTGSSGAATFVTNTLNIPNYTLAGLGGQASSTNLTSLSGLTFASTSFVKMTASGTFALDTATYLTANQSITLSGAVTGTGSTAITTTLANGVVGIANHSATGTPSATTYLRGDNTWATIPGGGFTGVLAAGTATVAPLEYTLAGSVLKTTPIAGDFEADTNGISYYSHADSSRGVMDVQQFISLTGTYTLTSQTAAQKLFNSTTNGALNVKAATTYYFECFYTLSSMSATSGSFGFAIGGTATLTSIAWTSYAIKATTGTTAATLQTTFNTTAANTTIVTGSTQTAGSARISGYIRVNAAGTIIPQVSLGVAAAAIVGVNSYFRIIPMGTNTVTSVGNWS